MLVVEIGVDEFGPLGLEGVDPSLQRGRHGLHLTLLWAQHRQAGSARAR